MLPNNLSFVDVETTGGSPIFNRVIEIGIIRVENLQVVKEYKTLINPGQHLNPFITELTGITPQDLEDAPTFYEVQDIVQELLADSVFVAHSARFDYGMLRQEFKRCESSFTAKQLCTVKLARLLYPGLGKYDLDTIINNFKFACASRHRAFDDAQVLWSFYSDSLKVFESEVLENAIDRVLKKPSVPLAISQETLESLPESPGVYIFYGDQETPLYIGKSKNIRDRVLSHFSNDYLSGTDMELSQETRRVEVIKTAGELGALLLESTLIKKEQPLYNRMLRHSHKMTILSRIATPSGYNSVEVVEFNQVSVQNMDNILGVFKSHKQAIEFLYKVAKEYSLCPKLLGIEKTKKYCFYSQLGQCNGACLGRELNLKYNLRFEEAFYKQKIRPWKFNGPILIRETGEESEAFLVDKWCLLGKIKEGEEVPEINSDYLFDFDTYKILSRYLANKANHKTIHSYQTSTESSRNSYL